MDFIFYKIYRITTTIWTTHQELLIASENNELVTFAIALETNYSRSYVPAWQLVFLQKQNHIQPFCHPGYHYSVLPRESLKLDSLCRKHVRKTHKRKTLEFRLRAWVCGAENEEQKIQKIDSNWVHFLHSGKFERLFHWHKTKKTARLWTPQGIYKMLHSSRIIMKTKVLISEIWLKFHNW